MEKDISRFLAKVDKTSSCWNWTAYCSPDGYGRFWDKSKQLQAHRYSYSVFVGNLIEGLTIDHLCSNRKCVNPSHLEQVTAAENIKRAFRKITHCKDGHELDGVSKRGGHTNRFCKTCRDKRSAEYYQNNKEQKKEYNKEYNQNNKEQRREYYQKNKEKILKQKREGYHKNKSVSGT
tara:strand:- start:27 stop:557 length:531 start_codon:yes stop_codon:yes gene_type:complete